MKYSIVLLLKISVFSPLLHFSQVGINTDDPKATLDLNGNMMIRVVPETTTLPGYKIMAINEDSFEVTNVSPALFSTAKNVTVSKATAATGLTLLGLDVNLFNTSWNILKFPTLEINPTNFTSTASDFYYTAPSSGKYIIDYSFRNNTLLTLGVQPNTRIGILKTTTGNVTTMIDSKQVTVVGALLASYYYENIRSIYELQAGDKIRFVFNRGGLNLDLGLLSSSSGTIILHKVSD